MIYILWLFLSVSAHAQQKATVGTDRFCGLDDTNAPATLQNCEAQAALDVETNVLGTAIIKRKGYSKTADLTIATAPVTGAYSFIDKNGNQQVIVCQDINCAHSVNGGAFSVIYSTATKGVARWSFADYNGTVFAVDDKNDQPWSYDGTTFTQPFSQSVPLGSLIEQSKDRLIISGVNSNPSGVYYSQNGVFTNFTTGVNSVDPWIDVIGTTGDKATALRYDQGNLYVFKRNSITLCLLGDQYTTVCYPIANTIGTSSPMSVVTAPDGIYFESQTGAYWKIPVYGLYGLELISKKISTFVKSEPPEFGNTGSNFQGSKTDWDAGTQTPLTSYDTSKTIGSIVDKSGVFTDSTTAAWAAGNTFTNIDTSVANTIQLTSNTVQDNWSNNLTAGHLNWTATQGSWFITVTDADYLSAESTPVQDLNNVIKTSSVTFSSGSWRFTGKYSGFGNGCSITTTDQSVCFEFRFMKDNSNNYYAIQLLDNTVDSTSHKLRLVKNIGGTTTPFTSVTATIAGGTNYTYEVQRSTDGRMFLLFNSVFVGSTTVDNAVGTPTTLEIAAGGVPNTVHNYFTNFYAYQYQKSGKFISQEFDTTFSTPTWGPLSSTFTVVQNVEGQIAFYTQVSTSPNNDLYDALVAASDTLKIASSIKQYIRFEADFTTFISTKTPTISAVGLAYATTGQFVTQCIQPGPNITTWGLLSCDTSNDIGAGSFVFYSTSAVSCAALPTGPPLTGAGALQNGWTLQTNNAALTISTNAAVLIGWRDLLGSATDQAQINSCQTNWSNGVAAQPVWGVYDPIKNSLYWSTSNNSLGTNNRVLKYDLNLSMEAINPWFPWRLDATALRFINNSLYFGSASSGTWNQFGMVNADNGTAINAYWQSKDFSCNQPFVDSVWNRTYAVARNEQGGSITQTTTNSLNSVDTFTINTSTSAAQNYVRAVHSLQNFSPASFVNMKFSNSLANSPFEVDGFSLDCNTQAPMDVNP